MDLQYWNNGIPVIEDDSADMKALVYWLNGEPYVVIDGVAGATAVLSGTAVPTITETDIVNGGKTIIITLANDTWVATVGEDNAITNALIAGIDSAQSEATGWDAVVKANMVYTDIVRTSDTVITITLGAEATYDITATEIITATIPATAVTGATEITATPTFTVTKISVASGNFFQLF